MSRADERYVISTTDDVIVSNTLERVGNNLELMEVFALDEGGAPSKRVIPLDEVISVIKESVLSEDVTSQFIPDLALV